MSLVNTFNAVMKHATMSEQLFEMTSCTNRGNESLSPAVNSFDYYTHSY